MSRSRKTNRDHAKQTQRPMVEDEVRHRRPLPESVQFTLSRFERIWIADSSTLEALFRKLKSLETVPKGQLGRWRIEEAFNTVKRLLGLSYLWTGSLNGSSYSFGQLSSSMLFGSI